MACVYSSYGELRFMGKIFHLKKKQSTPLEEIAAEIVSNAVTTKAMLILTLDADGSYHYRMYNPDNDLQGMVFAHKLLEMELGQLIEIEYE